VPTCFLLGQTILSVRHIPVPFLPRGDGRVGHRPPEVLKAVFGRPRKPAAIAIVALDAYYVQFRKHKAFKGPIGRFEERFDFMFCKTGTSPT